MLLKLMCDSNVLHVKAKDKITTVFNLCNGCTQAKIVNGLMHYWAPFHFYVYYNIFQL